MSWRSDLISGMTDRERCTLLAVIAGARPDAFDWAAESLGGSFGERFALARAHARDIALYPGADHEGAPTDGAP